MTPIHKLTKQQSSSAALAALNSTLSTAPLNDPFSRNIATQPELVFGHQDFLLNSSKYGLLDKSTGRFSINKQEFMPNVSDSVSPRSTASADGLNSHNSYLHHQSNSFYQHHPLELPSPPSSTSSQASKTNAPNISSLFGSYSPSPFTVSFLHLQSIFQTFLLYFIDFNQQPLLPNLSYDTTARCTLPSPTIFPPTPPPSAWNPFW